MTAAVMFLVLAGIGFATCGPWRPYQATRIGSPGVTRRFVWRSSAIRWARVSPARLVTRERRNGVGVDVVEWQP